MLSGDQQEEMRLLVSKGQFLDMVSLWTNFPSVVGREGVS